MLNANNIIKITKLVLQNLLQSDRIRGWLFIALNSCYSWKFLWNTVPFANCVELITLKNKMLSVVCFKHSWFKTFTMFCMLHVFFWVIPQRLNFICRRFGTLCLFHLHRQVGVKWLNLRTVGVSKGEKVGSEIAWADWKEGDRVGVGPFTKQVVKGGNDPTWRPRAGTWKCVRVGHGMAGQNYCVVGGCLLSLSLCRRGFQELLKVRPSSLLILCGCISSLIASLMSQSMYPVLVERSSWCFGGTCHLCSQGEVHQQEFILMCHISEDQNYLYLHLFTHAVMHLCDCICSAVFA